MNLAALVVSSLSLLAVVLVGWRSISLGERSAKASEDSAKASEVAAKATERSTQASVRAAEATERSVAASERAAALAATDARVRRIESVLDTVLAMREVFNEQNAAHESEVPPWTPSLHAPEALARLALCRKLEGRLVPFTDELDASTSVRTLTTTQNWNSGLLEFAISEVSELLKATVGTGATEAE